MALPSPQRRLKVIQHLELASQIIAQVKQHGDAALRELTLKYDGVQLSDFRADPAELRQCSELVPAQVKQAINSAMESLRRYHAAHLPRSRMIKHAPGIYLGELWVPYRTIGIYVPRGYFSSALMMLVPAKLAQVEQILVCTPPQPDGSIHPIVGYCCQLLGADQVFKLGGVQALAAMALGTQTVPRVQKIFGPGGYLVAAAKLALAPYVEFDLIAAPTELLVFAQQGFEQYAPWILADLRAQSEHANSEVILVTTSPLLAQQISQELECELVLSDLESCLDFINQYAPEHLIAYCDPQLIFSIKNAGFISLGAYSAPAALDYCSGACHLLPSSGYAELSSGLQITSFFKRIGIQQLTKLGLASIADPARILARAEGFPLHAESISQRL